MVGVTGRQGMLTPPRHLIPPPVFPGVRVSPFVYMTCNSYLNFAISSYAISTLYINTYIVCQKSLDHDQMQT
jgi:hypothetical protein